MVGTRQTLTWYKGKKKRNFAWLRALDPLGTGSFGTGSSSRALHSRVRVTNHVRRSCVRSMFNSKGRRAERGHCLAPIHPPCPVPVHLLLIAAVVESQLGCAAGDPIEAAALNRYAPIFDLFASCGGFANSDRSRPCALASIRRIRKSRASLLSCFSDLLLRGHLGRAPKTALCF